MSSEKRVLVVEDNPLNMELAVDVLEAAGYAVLQATTGQEAIDVAVAQGPDLILMDMGLPDMDGLEAVRTLLARDDFKVVPIVGLTAHAMAEDAEAAMEQGCSGYITKPIQLKSFRGTVSKFLEDAA